MYNEEDYIFSAKNVTINTFTVDEIDGYLYYFGGTAGVITLTGIAAAATYYLKSRPIPEKPLVPLDNQAPILEVSVYLFVCTYISVCESTNIGTNFF